VLFDLWVSVYCFVCSFVLFLLAIVVSVFLPLMITPLVSSNCSTYPCLREMNLNCINKYII